MDFFLIRNHFRLFNTRKRKKKEFTANVEKKTVKINNGPVQFVNVTNKNGIYSEWRLLGRP